jgi:hypothetical protein
LIHFQIHWNFYPKGSLNVIPISFNLQSYDDSKWKVEAGVAKGNSYRLTLLAPSVKSEGKYECSAEYDDHAPAVKEAKYIEIIGKYENSGSYFLLHAKISRGFVKNHLKITSETKEWQKIILKP